MGFRDVSESNQALLAKQAWKIFNEHDSLLSRIYKGRYFSSSTFLDCGKGFRPSYAWRSILHGKELLQRRLIKSIGDGQNTKVWLEKWIMDDHPMRPINKLPMIDINLDVAALISPEKKWQPEMVQELFPPVDANRILNTPVGGVGDRHIWAYTNHGSYNVKSGLWFLSHYLGAASQVLTSLEQSRNVLKQRIWKLQTLLKI